MAKAAVKVAILASGEGTNAERLIQAVAVSEGIDIAWVGCNREKAGVLARADAAGVPSWVFSKAELNRGDVQARLVEDGVDFVALVGFLLKVPADLVTAFSGRMLNLHPALLPAFGGKGMYGHHVHRAVHAALCEGAVQETGITMHWVDPEYDEGPPFFQASVPLDAAVDTPDTIAEKVRALEVAHYAPQALRAVVKSLSLSETKDP
ncbi:MAG: phosphoribosylglycinamide formyltransferase [Flavobacteriales bacterium]|nr:phosphoribosylglycinamide formyltransferase [Flavobacteriales bacterium]